MRYLVSTILIAFTLITSAQEDTVHLSEVTIHSDPLSPFTIGRTLKEIRIDDLDHSLSNALSGKGNLYFKSYGNNQLSTITMRGTSANQTNVLWHGIPANYPSLGQMDFSQWPTWFLNEIQVQSGNGGALFGSGSIGGTVLLDSNNDLDARKPGVIFRASLGSFGYFFTGVKGRYRIGQLTGHTKLYHTQIENDFPYRYNNREEVQGNAGSTDIGLQQQLKWGSDENHFQLDGMFTLNDREVQPTKGVKGGDELETTNTRLALAHQLINYSGSLNTTLAYIRNRTLYNEHDETITGQYSIVSTWSFEFDENSYRVGFNSNIYQVQSDNYVSELNDFRTGIFGSFSTAFSSFWELAINVRQSFFRDRYPFNPSLNHKFKLFSTSVSRLILSQSTSTGFRYPTLNDLYWTPGGNPELNPERSFNTDFEILWETLGGHITWDISMEAFKMWSKDYILWRPGQEGIWSPFNYQDVEISGFETGGSIDVPINELSQNVRVTYGYTKSLNQTGINIGNQLPYVPVHQASLNSESKWSDWSLSILGNYTSRRYTTLDNTLAQSVDGFLLIDLGLMKCLTINKLELSAEVKVNNVFDQDYENLINRAMPGRNYQLSILLKR